MKGGKHAKQNSQPARNSSTIAICHTHHVDVQAKELLLLLPPQLPPTHPQTSVTAQPHDALGVQLQKFLQHCPPSPRLPV
jgi:hypothetical protein